MDESEFAHLLLDDLAHPILWKYRMHALHYSKEDSTKIIIYASLKDFLISIGNLSQLTFIDKVKDKNYDGPIIFRDRKEENALEQKSLNRETAIYKRQEKEIDYSVTASAQTRQLKFWNALQNYKRDIRLRSSVSKYDKYYEQRAILHLILDEYRKSYNLAKKSNSYELMVALSFHESDFQNVLNLFEDVVMEIENTPVTVVTHFELFLMIGFSFLAKWNFYNNNNETFDEFLSYIEEDDKYADLRDCLICFRDRKFIDAIKLFNKIGEFSYLSLYMRNSWPNLTAEVNKNIAAHCVTPYASITIQEINKQTGLSRIDLPLILCEAIADGSISGKVDIVEKIFVAKPKQNTKQQQAILDSVITLKTIIQEGIWKAETSKQIKKMTKKMK